MGETGWVQLVLSVSNRLFLLDRKRYNSSQFEMPTLETCWSPCFYHLNVRSATYAIAFYTTMLSVLVIAHTSYVMAGGDSSQTYLPLYETNLSTSTQSAGTFMIFYFLVFIICSGLLVQGVRKEYRGLFFPWMIIMLLLCLFMAGYGLWLLIDYYILWNSFAVICIWLWMSYNIYCLICVYSQYKIVTEMQSRHIELLYP